MATMSARKHQHKGQGKLGAARRELAEREVDLVSYERVIVDLTTKWQLSGGEQVLALVSMRRSMIQQDCERLRGVVEDLVSTL